ncbi:MAG: hypothetical protein COA79_24300 [Planctomycetota bacterium]|nr:MAG: hypothetical protein COA79_24300 [Planctomycetota bacterium]
MANDDASSESLGKFGKIVVEKKYASLNNVKAVIKRQRQLVLKGQKVRLGDLMVKLKVISPEQRSDVLNIQNAVQLPIPGYEIMEKLGQGGMGAVYLGRQINMDRKVAIKTLNANLASKKSNIKKFLKEAKSVAQLNHNNIVKGIDVGQNKGRYYFIMEYVDGPTIQKVLDDDGIVEETRALSIAKQMADAIRYINQANFVHRDIKPDNIILTSKGVPKLADLGLVLSEDDKDDHDKSESLSASSTGVNTTFVGTPHYISPEQAQEQDVDFRSDIYSLGATLFHMVTGRTPFEGDRSIIIMTKHITEDVIPPNEINSVLSKGVNDLILKMMEKEPNDRQQSPEELIQDITTVIETRALPGAAKKKRPKKKRRSLGTSNRRRRKRVKRRPTSTSRRRPKSSKIKMEEEEDSSESSRLEVTTNSFLLSELDLDDAETPAELLKMSKETNDYKLKEQYLLQAMRDEDDDEISLEAKCRYSYLISVLKKEEAIEILLEVIEDYIDYSENKYYGLAEKKLKELNQA